MERNTFSRRRSYSSRNNNNRRSRSSGFNKQSNINPQKYVATAQSGNTCSIYDDNCKFDDFDVNANIQRNIKSKGFTSPTKIQAQAIPCLLKGRDLLGLAQTGSGKTAAFLIPMIDKVSKNDLQKCLIVTPTRELADQIETEFRFFSKGTNLKSVLVIGGASMGKQIGQLKQRPDFVIATPGRLLDLERRRIIDIRLFNNIVLDEVDRMLDMGFIHDIKLIISKLAQKKQSLFFSATMNEKIEEIARSLLQNPIKIQVEDSAPQKNVDQSIVRVTSGGKLNKLHDLLIDKAFEKVLIFSRTRRRTDRLSRDLSERGFNVDSIHGGKTQSKRDKVIQRFKQDKINLLIATDVAARGLDIDDITHVINFDEPAMYDDYIHRIGRTGRAGKKGCAITFVE